MQNGNLAEAQLRALIDVAAAAAGAHRLEEVLELAAERALAAIGGASLSVSRWDMDAGLVRTLVNVGDLGPGEQRFPEDETYSVEDYPSILSVMNEGRPHYATVDDEGSDPAMRALLQRLGKESSLAVPMILDGKPWGELEVMTAPGRPRVTSGDVDFLRAIADQLVAAIHRAELFAQIEALAYTDSLTGVASRRAVEKALEEACAEPAGPGAPALVLCDIDNLKQVNDAGGHAAGDRALCAAADALVAAAAPHEDAVVGRFGGDEFCVLLPSGTEEDARAVALDAVRRLGAAGGEQISCGLAARTEEPAGPANLLRAADEAQYRAKRAGDLDVVAASDPPDEMAAPQGRDRAYRASDSEAALARELLDLLDEMGGASADERLARVRARLERGA
ncbi:MAG TPA: sensor domain-containing diguanylate cyclase [Thermoleophilaceae bacterium]|nr:sensor domain-containing diguanylate cyclase [Thermoleophilaceae bacterium]